jgi:SAM-dependent methyltransferase
MLEDYQIRFLHAVRRVISTNWLISRPRIRMLDMGCDCSGRQLAELSRLIRGTAVGINIPESFPSESAIATAGRSVELIRMDGMRLQFPDATFDLVISANVIEHVPDPVKFIREAARVLKPDGVCYLETAPIWTGPRGHHVMESMIAENCPWETNFRDDGSIIPDWSHLSLSRAEMAIVIGDKVHPATLDYILRYLYDSGDLNRTPWSVISGCLREAFTVASVHAGRLSASESLQMPVDDREDYRVYGFHAICRHNPQNWLAKRLFWRLRRIGL